MPGCKIKIPRVSLDIIDKWLHHSENGKSIITLLINMNQGQLLRCDVTDFQRIDSSINSYDGIHIKIALDEYFNMHGYPFETHYNRKENPPYLYIKKMKPLLYCPIHNVSLKTESEFIEHQKCSYISTTEKIEHPINIVIEDKDRESENKVMKKKEEERKAKDRTR